MPYNFVDDQFSHKKNFVADFLHTKCDFRRKTAVLLIWGSLSGTQEQRTMIMLDYSINTNRKSTTLSNEPKMIIVRYP